MTWLLRRCPKCTGDMYQERDGLHCLQCGRLILVGKNIPLAVDYSVSHSGSLDNRRPRSTRRGGGRVNPCQVGYAIGAQNFFIVQKGEGDGSIKYKETQGMF